MRGLRDTQHKTKHVANASLDVSTPKAHWAKSLGPPGEIIPKAPKPVFNWYVPYHENIINFLGPPGEIV